MLTLRQYGEKKESLLETVDEGKLGVNNYSNFRSRTSFKNNIRKLGLWREMKNESGSMSHEKYRDCIFCLVRKNDAMEK